MRESKLLINATEYGNLTAYHFNHSNASDMDCLEVNPWCELSVEQKSIEVAYLLIIAIFGTLGNLMLIVSIVLESRTYRLGNIFIINLAFADFIITGVYTPIVIGNVIHQGNVLPSLACKIFGYVIMASCTCSMWNLALIAFNRYWAIIRHSSYNFMFAKQRIHVMLVLLWIYSLLIPIPAATGWTTLEYDAKAMVCAWDNVVSQSFTIYLITGAILIPLGATFLFYGKLFWYVRNHAQRLRRASIKNSENRMSERSKQRWLQREISLLKALATAVVFFVLCWTPYAVCVFIDNGDIDPYVKKICTWLGLNNSAVNFIIYGFINQEFRKGYKKLLKTIFCCYRKKKIPSKKKQQLHQAPIVAKQEDCPRMLTKSLLDHHKTNVNNGVEPERSAIIHEAVL